MVLQSNNINKPVEGENVLLHGARTFTSHDFRSVVNTIASRTAIHNRELKPTKYALKQLQLDSATKALDGLEEEYLKALTSEISCAYSHIIFLWVYPLRPKYMEVSKQPIEAIDPVLANVDVNYIRDILMDKALGPSMYQATQKYTMKEPSQRPFPNEVRITLEDIPSIYPTHMLVVHEPAKPKANALTDAIVKMCPVHSLVFAAHCAKFPLFPPHIDPPEGGSDAKELTLPVMRISLSSPKTFPILMEYLYLKHSDVLLCRLLFLRQPPHMIHQPDQQELLARNLATQFPLQHIEQISSTVTGVWGNTRSLGVYDDELWAALDIARKVVLMAFAARQKRSDVIEFIKAAAAELDGEQEST